MSNEEEVIVEAPVEEAPVEEAPVEEAPVEEAVVEEAVVEEAVAITDTRDTIITDEDGVQSYNGKIIDEIRECDFDINHNRLCFTDGSYEFIKN